MITDFFGIGSALRAIAVAYFNGCRQSGRTTKMIESVKDGDRIVFLEIDEARRVHQILKNRGVIDVQCIVISASNPEKIFERTASKGRTIFDHSWIEDYYCMTLQKAEQTIHSLEKEASGYGEPHRNTREKAVKIDAKDWNKW